MKVDIISSGVALKAIKEIPEIELWVLDERDQIQHRIKITREDPQQIVVTINGTEVLTHLHGDGKRCIAYLENGQVCSMEGKEFCNL